CDAVAKKALAPSEMAFEDRGAGERDCGVSGWKRLIIARVRALPMRRELQRLNEHLRENLRLQQVHSQVRRLGLIENPSDGIRPQGQHHLLWRVPELLSRRDCG